MIYTKECLDCGEAREISCRISEHETIVKPDTICPSCGGRERQVIENSLEIRHRSPFPKGLNDNCTYGDPIYLRDKSHARDVLAERGLGSKFIDDDC